MNEEHLNEHSCLNGATKTKKQVPKTNTVIRNLRVIPDESMPDNEIWFLDKTNLKIHKIINTGR